MKTYGKPLAMKFHRASLAIQILVTAFDRLQKSPL